MLQLIQNNESKHLEFGRFFKLSAPILRFIAILVVGFITQNSYAAFSGKVIYNYVTDPTIQFSSPETACQAYLKTEQAGFGYPLTFQRAEAVSPGPLSDYTCYSTHSNPSATNPYLWLYVVRTNPQCGANADGSASGNAIVCTCQSGFVERHNSCVPAGEETTTPIVSKNAGGGTSCNLIGNPINPGTGSKYLLETDYVSGSMPLELRFERSYNSQYDSLAGNQSLGTGWRHNYSRSLILDTTDPTIKAEVLRADGRSVSFTKTTSGFVADPGVSDKLASITSTSGAPAYAFTEAETGNTETFNTNGQLISIRNLAGWSQVLTYSNTTTPPAIASAAGLLIEVKDQSGRTLQLRYNTINQLTTLIDPAGQTYTYSYDLADNLAGLTYPDSKIRTYLYESSLSGGSGLLHALTGIIDENNARFSTYEYDISGKAFRTEHAGGALKYVVTYNADGSSTVVDPLVTSRTYNFSVVQNVSSPAAVSQPCASCGGTASSTTYDAGGNALTRVDFNGNQTCYAYDAQGRNLEIARVEGLAMGANCATALAAMTQSGVARKITTDWHPTFRLPTKITESGRETTYAYDSASGNVLTKSIKDLANGKLRRWTYSYTTAADGTLPNLLKTVNGPRADGISRDSYRVYSAAYDIVVRQGPLIDSTDITTYSYNANGDLKTVTTPLGHVTTINQYDPHGRPQNIVDPNGLVTVMEYWPRGWLKRKTTGAEVTRYDYDAVGQVTQIINPDGSTVRYTYDNAHRLTDIHDGLNNRTHYILDAMGNRTKEEIFNAAGSLGYTHSRKFDALNRLWQDIGAFNQITTYTYDANGNLKTEDGPRIDVTDTTIRNYDALNRLINVTAADNGFTQYAYDPLDQIKVITDPKNQSTRYTTNVLGETTQTQSPDSGITARTFDEAGTLKTETDARGFTTTYSYDGLNRLMMQKISDSNTPVFTYGYDNCKKGKLCSIYRNGSFHQTYSYDTVGRLSYQLSVAADGTRATSAYSYDATTGLLKQITYPSGRTVNYVYNTLGKINQISTNNAAGTALQVLASAIQYSPFGPVQAFNYGNGLSYLVNRDQDYRPATANNGATSTVFNYDLASNMKTLSEGAAVQTFNYDAVNRLKSAATTALNAYGSLAYSYDTNGNRSQETRNGTLTPYIYNPAGSNWLSQIGTDIRTKDAAGNTTSGSAFGALGYDGYRRMLKSSNQSAVYEYNALGQRTKKSTSTGNTYFHYGQNGELLYEVDNLGQKKHYVYLNGMLIARIDNDVPYYYHTDHLGTPQAMTDAGKSVVWQAKYEPFGKALIKTQTVVNNVRLPGQYFDAETGLSQNGYRDYDSSTGRYIQTDPIGLEGGVNTYSYVDGNPLSFIDPLGLAKCDGEKGAKLKPTLIQENPHNLIPTQTKSQMSGSQVKRLTKDMKQNGYDQSKPVDARRNPDTGRLEIQDGHHRTEAAKKAGLAKIPVQVWE